MIILIITYLLTECYRPVLALHANACSWGISTRARRRLRVSTPMHFMCLCTASYLSFGARGRIVSRGDRRHAHVQVNQGPTRMRSLTWYPKYIANRMGVYRRESAGSIPAACGLWCPRQGVLCASRVHGPGTYFALVAFSV